MMRQRNVAKTTITFIIAAVVLLMMLTAQVSYTLSDQGVQVSYRYLVLLPTVHQVISYDTIQSVEVLDQLPKIRKITGFESFGRKFIGRFTSEGIGEFQAYIQNSSIPQLLIKTSGKTYMLSPNEIEVFARQVIDQTKR